jgi:triacylglycerol lipase
MSMAFQKRPIPRRLLDFKYLRAPNLQYPYFSASATAPFQPHARAHSAVNATWLADAALLAYAPPHFALPTLHAAGLRAMQCVTGKSTQAYLAEGDGFVLAAFRGTRIDNLTSFVINMANNLKFSLQPAADASGQVHRGFQDSLDEVWPRVGPALRKYRDAGLHLWLTGHSLGAAMAALAAARLGGGVHLCTFASPRVGDDDFAASLGAAHLARFVYDDDVIPRIPPREFGYAHGLTRRLIDRDGGIRVCEDPSHDPDLSGKLDYARGLLQLNLFDHSPVLYAVHVWNAFTAGQNSDG